MTDSIKVFAIEARTRYHVLAHTRKEALERLIALDGDGSMELYFEGGHQPWIDTIHSCAVPESDVEEIEDPFLGGVPEEMRHEHSDSCPVCSPTGRPATPS